MRNTLYYFLFALLQESIPYILTYVGDRAVSNVQLRLVLII